ncbi:MAG: glycosyltransferase family 39 protein, partial [Anaerolineae bacterium]|nr:glycosyltransferase family 39 protein [Anaerolineae bacterium]
MRQFWVVILTLLGAGLRVYQLTARSLWTDESITLIRIQHSWGDIFRNHVYLLDMQTIDTNPFVYFAALKLWSLGAGSSEFALKLFSAWLGVLLIPLTYALGRRLFGHRAGLLAALFVLLSPGIEWYSHELRMYTLVGCLSALNGILTHQTMVKGQWSMVNAERGKPHRRFLILLCMSGLASIATHYTFVGQVAGLWGLVALGMWQRQRGGTGWRLSATQQRLGLAVIIIASIGAIGLSTSSAIAQQIQRLVMGQESDYFFVPLHMMWNSVINGFVFGLNAGDPTGGLFAWGLCAVAIWAFIAAPKSARAVLIAGGLMPLLVWFGISFIKSNFQGLRHMFLLLPYIAVALAGWLTVHGSRLAARGTRHTAHGSWLMALSSLILAAQSYGLVGMFTPSEHWHDDWRSVAQHVRRNWLAGDVLLLNSQTVHGAIALYAPDLKWEITPPVQTNQRDQADADKLRTLSQSHRRIWFVHEKPNNSISAWLR